MHLASDAEFTINAMQLLIRKARKEDSRTPHVYIFTDNVNWATRSIVDPFRTRNHSDFVPYTLSRLSHGSRTKHGTSSRQCLFPASTSTYGWWLAFLSRGQRVYYNREYASPGAHADEFSPEDFWPQHWIPLHAYRRNHVVEL
ncbi:hypothetical protein OESDEN_12997 [Oesophagostomum dentatum]|uniref:Uncharacterized protein n=1 Tax=Oesophagostomum dentatum TaxID=61180 RepID=A0A0B1SPJ6_OESDE|nr:hypothetical protein OESDEN_12997 [Oesophagostomum dentatum]